MNPVHQIFRPIAMQRYWRSTLSTNLPLSTVWLPILLAQGVTKGVMCRSLPIRLVIHDEQLFVGSLWPNLPIIWYSCTTVVVITRVRWQTPIACCSLQCQYQCGVLAIEARGIPLLRRRAVWTGAMPPEYSGICACGGGRLMKPPAPDATDFRLTLIRMLDVRVLHGRVLLVRILPRQFAAGGSGAVAS